MQMHVRHKTPIDNTRPAPEIKLETRSVTNAKITEQKALPVGVTDFSFFHGRPANAQNTRQCTQRTTAVILSTPTSNRGNKNTPTVQQLVAFLGHTVCNDAIVSTPSYKLQGLSATHKQPWHVKPKNNSVLGNVIIEGSLLLTHATWQQRKKSL